jgi:signal transduction histidine kinase
VSDEELIAELQADLVAAHRTIEVLITRIENTGTNTRASTEPGAPNEFESALMLAKILDEREREVKEAQSQLSAAQSEFRALTSNLDQIVKQRTRALGASEAQLRQKNHELEQQSSIKAEFISIAAHELRTPLTSIVGYLDLFSENRFGPLPAPMVRPIASVRRNAHRLKRLVNEMLDVSRIEAGRVALHRVPVDLGDLVREVATELAPLAQARQQLITTVARPIAPLMADRDKLNQVAVNLLSNAIRYSHDGGEITLTVDDAPVEQYPGGWARLRVLDKGSGIAEEHRSRIFEPFFDVQPAKHHTSTGPGSSGLGLYIARGLVELHGGLITVDSVVDEFAEFTVLLPRG